jgi:hypothetical protein
MWLAAHALGIHEVFMGEVLLVEALVRERYRLQGDLVGGLALGQATEGRFAPKTLTTKRVVRDRP